MSLAFPDANSSFLMHVSGAAARSLALGCAAALGLTVMRVKDVSVKLLVWRGVLAAALAMPLLELVTPAVRVPMPLPRFEARSSDRSDSAAQASAARHFPRSSSGSLAVSTEPLRIADASKTPGYAPPADVPPSFLMAWPNVLLAIYLAIAIWLLARVFVGLRWAKRLAGSASPIEDSGALRLLTISARTANLRQAPRLAESQIVSVPVTLGARNPVILLPTDWPEWGAVELETVLAHEVSHVSRRDPLIQRLALVHRAIFWFSPLAWWLDRHLANLAEQASDEAALAGGADRTRYAEMLLGFFVALGASRERVWWQGVSMANVGQAERRIDRILAWRRVMSKKLRKSLLAGLAAVAAPIVLLTAAVHPSVYNFEAPANPEPTPSVIPAANPGPAPHGQEQTPPRQNPDDDTITVSGGSMTITDRVTGRYDWDEGPRFVIVTKNSNSVTMSGSEEDARHARSLRNKIPGDFVWFERDEKSYIIRDQATVDRAKKFWEPEEELSRKQEELGKEQEALGKQQEALGEKMEQVRVKIPDMSAEMQALIGKMKELSANGGTQEEIGELQSRIGELQSRVGEVQSDAGRQQSEIGRQQGELGRKQGELGRQQGELGRQQGEVAKQARRQMNQLLDDAIAHRIAQPE